MKMMWEHLDFFPGNNYNFVFSDKFFFFGDFAARIDFDT